MEDPRLIQNAQSSRGGRAASLIIVAVLQLLLLVVSSAGAATVKHMRITPTLLKNATATVPYEAQLSAVNGTAPYAYTIQSGSLPQGLVLTPSGALSGTPSAAGTSTFTVHASDSAAPAQSATRTYTLTVQLDLLPLKLKVKRANEVFLVPLGAAGGEGGYTYSLASGSILPPGVEFYGYEGEAGLAGPVKAAGLYKFTLDVTDAAGHVGMRTYTMNVGLAIFPEIWDVRPGIVGEHYAQNVWIEGGSSNYTYSIINGSLPEGTTLNAREGGEAIIEGTPAKSGLYRATILGTDTETGRTVKLHIKVPVFSAALPFQLSRLEEEGGEGGEQYVRLSPEGEGHGEIWGSASFGMYGTFTYDLATHQLHVITYAEADSVVSEYNATCEPATHTCTGTGPHGKLTVD